MSETGDRHSWLGCDRDLDCNRDHDCHSVANDSIFSIDMYETEPKVNTTKPLVTLGNSNNLHDYSYMLHVVFIQSDRVSKN